MDECHNDSNAKTYNGKRVGTPHGGSYGYPAANGVWKWNGVYKEIADAIPEIKNSATGDHDEQAKLSRYFHTIHLARLRVPEGVKGDSRGLMSCSSCHQVLTDRPETPKQTCAACLQPRSRTHRDQRFESGSAANCISAMYSIHIADADGMNFV